MKPLILISNDDGIHAPGLRYLINIMKTYGDVTVVSPEKPMSGMAHAITVTAPLRLKKVTKEAGYEEYSCNGTPTDAVKLALKILLNKKPDLIVSGINHGSNSSINVIYSGTMSVAMEGAIEGIPAIGFSILDYSFEADFTASEKYMRHIIEKVLKEGLPVDTCLNVNIPAVKAEEIKGIKVCRQAKAIWNEEFLARKDAHFQDYYWLTGAFNNLDADEDTDEWALGNNYISLVPVHCDLTAYKALPQLKKWELNA